MRNLAHQNILVLGLGASGLALARWCARCGARVTVADTRPAPPQLAALQGSMPNARFINAAMDGALLDSENFNLVLKSPGLSPASIAGVVAAARAQGIPCGNELSLFAQALAELKQDRGYAPRVIGITGTNGKTTVTSLTGQLIERAGKTVAVAGNIGPTLLDTLIEKLEVQARDETLTLPEVWVLELSSFQLDGVANFQPDAATVLNVSQDHLDWHETLTAYAAAKANVYGSAGLMLLNRDDPQVMAALPAPVKGRQIRHYLTFGGDEPRRPGDYGIQTVNGMAWLVRAAEADETLKRRKTEDVVLHIQRLMPLEALRIHGRHNAANALAALGLAVAVGCPLAPMLHGLREYRGEPHRVESVAVLQGVEYFDDSKATNVGATVAALAGLGVDRKLVLILGGEGKGQDFSALADPVARYVRTVVLIGRDAPLIRAALQGRQVELLEAASMAQAVSLAAAQAHAGDAVLMSPACASFDMFDNYQHRARVFCEAVQELAVEQGAVL
ncbi:MULTISPECIES: UDP-N-acetylmuramoyl-L-alanine--D-glutamate ligase [unclassified Polaromonas]|uniref:UDP-N-acetylmuramoyl-L-alanine--D-glutamate ligase n=1 Tax=unclassified Polaromonas TaxID=2638319 RepID=UPI0018CA4441|nr:MULTISPECIES: UDP-N-acetylmuramoyl-L-alanine--D-glutamate ligase [unclassified Polaromonas]MBG6070885.1 UDP-N-acetylmuramoylalanine--D-glutamate ligase [Polaromonas sp. CG_9.7]MBG6112805.1 UDP-N-acetylmuramoylalanine--D-glutamate ligase [Polaromonas sp. CG_9.2]MDH6186280.1 UDP-N-acetylmuramoylalanine--D-glutamate ligase [Polaromonas sp. CG_23.6]